LLLAAAMRLAWLGHRPLHHDESIHAYYSWRILTVGPSDYRYDRVYHGPGALLFDPRSAKALFRPFGLLVAVCWRP
jgi:predicted membrane-bound mannosyltransferase